MPIAGTKSHYDAILLEVGDAFASNSLPIPAGNLIRTERSAADTRIVPLDDELFQTALRLYMERPDKAWSITDCISFTVMTRLKISKALTQDHHFAQAGFQPIFA